MSCSRKWVSKPRHKKKKVRKKTKNKKNLSLRSKLLNNLKRPLRISPNKQLIPKKHSPKLWRRKPLQRRPLLRKTNFKMLNSKYKSGRKLWKKRTSRPIKSMNNISDFLNLYIYSINPNLLFFNWVNISIFRFAN